MPDKKDSEPPKSPKEEALEQRIDAMLDPKKPSAEIPVSDNNKPVPPIDIFHDSKTAPEMSDKLLEQIGAAKPDSQEATQPVSKIEQPANLPPQASETAPAKTNNSTKLDDTDTDRAVDDIVANEGDTILAIEDAAAKPPKPSKDSGWKAKLVRLLKNKRTWISLLAVLVVLFAVPFTRYKLLGLIVKEPVTVTVVDSKTATPVSNAIVQVAGKTAKTDANGKTKLSLPLGQAQLKVSKQYYQTHSSPLFIGFKAANRLANIHLAATGRQVPITVINKISGQPINNAEIKVLNTTAKTNKQGKATIVLPTTANSDNATIDLNGYNQAKVSVQVTSNVVSGNSFSLTPAGHIYFLSNLSGTIDVVKSNLDGTGRHTVLSGTGKEDPNTTSLLASRDWRYLVLKARRDTAEPALYLIDTSNDKVTGFESGDTNFTLVGWYGHNFIYDAVHNAVSGWQAGREVVKSYDADTGQPNQLDQNQADGSASSYSYQSFANFYVLDGVVVYNTQWYTFDSTGNGYSLGSKTDTIRAVQSNGQGKKDYQTFPAAGLGYIQAALYAPEAVYYAVYSNSDNKLTYYNFENQTVAVVNNIDQTALSQHYPTYLLSPSGDQTFWSELRDGKNTLFLGDANGKNQKQIASLSDYSPYGWFSDNYLLVSKGGSELYIMSTANTSRQPLKLTDYYKPSQTYPGYGYGYGGL